MGIRHLSPPQSHTLTRPEVSESPQRARPGQEGKGLPGLLMETGDFQNLALESVCAPSFSLCHPQAKVQPVSPPRHAGGSDFSTLI